MADLLTIVLGQRLYVPEERSLDGPLPSPDALRGMVVLKGRRPSYGNNDDESADPLADEENGSLLSAALTEQTSSTAASSASRYPPKIAPQLARLTLLHGTAFKSWHASCRTPDHHMHSFAESKVRSMCRSVRKRRDWVSYNRTHISRIFPSGARVDSSNYNPIPAWSAGCQMVALNFQTSETPPLRINDGRFRENGGCGYVLKPPGLLGGGGGGGGQGEREREPPRRHMASTAVGLTVRVLTGSCLPKPKGRRTGECIDPYVRVEVFDADPDPMIAGGGGAGIGGGIGGGGAGGGDVVRTAYQTSPAGRNGFFPIWDQEDFNFDVGNGDVAVLQLTVWERKEGPGRSPDFIASASIPLTCLRQGYRSVRLYDANNTQSGAFDFASLLIKVQMKKVAEEI